MADEPDKAEAEEPEVDLSTIPAGTPEEDVVKPVALASELKIRPQIVFGWIRNAGLNAYKDSKGKNVILRSEFAEWQKTREEKKAEREAKKAEKEAADKAKAEKAAAEAESGETSSEEEEEAFT